MDSVAELWRRIDTWFQAVAPTRAAQFCPGATSEELAEAEARLGLTLPADFKASYRIHNGAEGNYLLMWYPDFYSLDHVYSFREMFPDNTQLAERTPGFVSDPARQSLPIQPVWWHPQWVTFAGDGGGYQWCLDLAPAPGGKSGQVIGWDHEDGPASLLFPSFEALLSSYADQLEAGLCVGTGPIGTGPFGQFKERTHLQERRAAFQEPSPAKPLLLQAMRSGWYGEDMEDTLTAFKQVLQMEAATPEDRFFAYYGLIIWCLNEWGYEYEALPLFVQYEAEAHGMEASHWVHEEVALMKSWPLPDINDDGYSRARY